MITAVVDEQKLAAAKANFTLTPYPSRVFVYEMEMPEKVGSIYLPSVDQNMKEFIVTEGIVVGIGEDITFCSVGDHIYYAKYSGTKCIWNGHEYRVMNEADLLGKEVSNG